MALNDTERFARQLLMSEVGIEGQKRLLQSHVLIVGAGGLGSPLIHALAAAGVGHLRIVDCDTVSPSNLNRQTLYQVADIGKSKAEKAGTWVKAFYPECRIEACSEYLGKKHLTGIDIAVDAVDNYRTRLLLDRLTEEAGIPMVHGSVSGLIGNVATFVPGRSRYRDLFGNPDDDSEKAPPQVLGVTAQTIGSIEAAEVLKQILGLEGNLSGRLLTADLRTYDFRLFDLP